MRKLYCLLTLIEALLALIISISCTKNKTDNVLYVIQVNQLYGCINKSGNVVIKPQFDGLSHYFGGALDFSKGLIAAKAGDKYGFINSKGKYIMGA
jgi:hypothetical protein